MDETLKTFDGFHRVGCGAVQQIKELFFFGNNENIQAPLRRSGPDNIKSLFRYWMVTEAV